MTQSYLVFMSRVIIILKTSLASDIYVKVDRYDNYFKFVTDLYFSLLLISFFEKIHPHANIYILSYFGSI